MHLIKGIRKIALGISGGVDSAVAALLLKKRGFEVVGLFMRNWDLTDETGFCSLDNDILDAEYICKVLNIKFHNVNFVKEYWNEVFSELISDYKNGLTPNPDILCNKKIKFSNFFRVAQDRFGCDTLATGHYARNSLGEYLEQSNTQGAHLLTAVDPAKDQTFFLSQIPQDALQRTIFPLGQLTKAQVKQIAIENNFERIAKKKESMGICFIGSRHFQSFIQDYIKPSEGNFIDIDTGEIVGKHPGRHYWTIGQRCNIPGVKMPFYIALKTDSHDIYVAKGHEHPIFYSSVLTTRSAYWVHSEPQELKETKTLKCQFRFQHRKPLVTCSLYSLGGGRLHVMLDTPLRALTPGQYAVFYKGPICLGSSRIDYVGPTEHTLNFKIPINQQCDHLLETEQKLVAKN